MYSVTKRLEVSGSHVLDLPYKSKCQHTHGHNWIINITIGASALNAEGMVLDFTAIKELIHAKLDHTHLNDVVSMNPTAENIAKWIYDRLDGLDCGRVWCMRVEVQESEGNIACYTP